MCGRLVDVSLASLFIFSFFLEVGEQFMCAGKLARRFLPMSIAVLICVSALLTLPIERCKLHGVKNGAAIVSPIPRCPSNELHSTFYTKRRRK